MVTDGRRAGPALLEADAADVEAARSGADAVSAEDERSEWAAGAVDATRAMSAATAAARKRPAMSSPFLRPGFSQTARTEARDPAKHSVPLSMSV